MQSVHFDQPVEKLPLWSHSMRCLAYAQFLLYMAVYMLLPVMPYWIANGWGVSYVEAGWITALFAPAMWLTGPFNSYLIDAFPRKSVAIWGCLVFIAATVGMLYVNPLWMVVVLRLAQGVAFSVATMAIGSTLAIDVAPSNRRTDANVAFLWIARVGMALGLACGYLLYSYEGLTAVWLAAAVLAGVAFLCIPMVSVPFRAPLHAPLCTLDRFFLPRAWVPMVILLWVVTVGGVVANCIYLQMAYFMLVAGVLVGWVVWRWMIPGLPRAAALQLGQAASFAGLLLLAFASNEAMTQCIASFLTSLGLCLTASFLFHEMVDRAKHCERGSAVNSFQLLWELGMMIGVVVATMVSISASDFLYMICAVLSLVVVVLDEGVNRVLKNDNI
jgi:MFS family permease